MPQNNSKETYSVPPKGHRVRWREHVKWLSGMPKKSSKKQYLVPGPKARLRQGTFEKPWNVGSLGEEGVVRSVPFFLWVFYLFLALCFFFIFSLWPFIVSVCWHCLCPSFLSLSIFSISLSLSLFSLSPLSLSLLSLSLSLFSLSLSLSLSPSFYVSVCYRFLCWLLPFSVLLFLSLIYLFLFVIFSAFAMISFA